MRSGDDIYAGKDGTVYRKGETGWEKNSGGGWTPTEGGATIQGKSTSQDSRIQTGQVSATREARNTDIDRSASPQRDISSGSSVTSARTIPGTQNIQSLERQSSARSQGQVRTRSFRAGGFGGGGGAQMRRRR